MRLSFPDTIAARNGLTTVLCLALLAVTNLGLAYLEESPDTRLAEWLVPARIIDTIHILQAAPPSQRSNIAASLSTVSLGVSLRDNPTESAELLDTLLTPKLRRLIQMGMDGAVGASSAGLKASTNSGASPPLKVSSLGTDKFLVQIPLSQNQWAILNVRLNRSAYSAWTQFALRACVSLLIIAALSILAARMLAQPIANFGQAAEQLGMGNGVSQLPERGPRELRAATRAFNSMQERLRRFIEDRTQMLAAISHDLRTPLARLRLRAEFMEDKDQRNKTLCDLDAMSDMINAVLAFARDDAQREKSALVDLSVIVADICDDLSETGAAVSFVGAPHLDVVCRPVAIRRAITNLIENAIKYGGCARVELVNKDHVLSVIVDDDGPGISPDEQDKVFAPFYRLEQSRNQETGGVGLGLSVARSIAKEHGGVIRLSNRVPTGLRAQLQLPA